MGYKCKNPYLDNNIDGKFVYILNSVLINKNIGLHQGFAGLWLDENKIGILETDLDFEMCTFREKSIYEVFNKCIPEGMRYNKELDKLVPDVISAADEYCSGSKVEFEKVVDYTEKNHRSYNIGSSNYATMKIQPWDIWKDWKLDPWDADIIKRISRTKEIPGKTFEEARIEDYKKIKHICDEKIYQLKEKLNVK